MDLLEASLNKKRSALEANGGTKKKYIRRADLEKQRQEEYQAEQERLRLEKEEKERRRKEEEDAEDKRRKRIASKSQSPDGDSTPDSGSSTPGTTGTTTTNNNSGSSATGGKKIGDGEGNDLDAAMAMVAAEEASAGSLNIPPEEVIRRLRARGQPIRLFGETDQQRKIRLRALELVEDRSEGQRNDFMRALENAETELHLEVLGQTADSSGSKKKDKNKEKAGGDQESKQLDTSEISIKLIQKDQDKLYVLLYTYFKRRLREWEYDLDERPDEVKRSASGKMATATQAQTAEYLKPFFKQLRQKALEPDVLMRITEIAELMIKKEYMSANDAYLRLSIGNAPWPIGVTMVGIHERSGREKIFSAQVAHVLNDETSRKWIQSVKRIMTFVEKKYPR
ncbi:mRNA splicing protein prp18 [Actinomortierella ambigua]|uniref:Pre-mRNA-splicing factor 18 n=1 Tax=Actinomortierella ambigua TaxID=1343610 RepID=A0A9P6U346_9FUNG|nr:mRNA splicing protein prp18 [Actinomortierella ambigua]